MKRPPPGPLPGEQDKQKQCAPRTSGQARNSAAPIILVDQVTVGFGGRPVFADLSLCLYAGEQLALLGPNGAGKSTLLRLLQGDLRPFQDRPGRIVWNFEGTPDSSPLCARAHVRSVSPAMQSRYIRQGWNITGEEIILSGLDNAAMVYGELPSGRYRQAARLAEAANAQEALLGMSAPSMSQGQLRLVLILRALMGRPSLLLLDEPFDGLDSAARASVADAISLAAQNGVALLVSAHRREDIPKTITDALLVHQGRLQRLPLGALPESPFCAASPDGAATVSVPPLLAPARADTPLARAIRQQQTPLFQLANVDVFIDRKQVLFDISWRVQPGEQWIVSGRNGSGKSTLLRLLYGEEFAAYGGEIRWCGLPRPGLDELRSSVGYVSDGLQDAYEYDLSAEEVVVSGLRGHIGLYDAVREEERKTSRLWLRRMGLESFASTPFRSLSSGAARRVLLARALAGAPPVLLLDEPCSGLDEQSRTLFLNTLPLLARQGVSMIYVSHHERDKSPLFTHELRLQNGRTAYAGKRRA